MHKIIKYILVNYVWNIFGYKFSLVEKCYPKIEIVSYNTSIIGIVNILAFDSHGGLTERTALIKRYILMVMPKSITAVKLLHLSF